jgi:hypothetical protein
MKKVGWVIGVLLPERDDQFILRRYGSTPDQNCFAIRLPQGQLVPARNHPELAPRRHLVKIVVTVINLKNAAALTIACLISPAWAAPQAKTESCGWLVLQGDELVAQPDPDLQPSDPKPLVKAPTAAKAAYCARDTLMTYEGDERVIKLGLPLAIRNGDREGVLEASPDVLFNYHKVGDKYLPGKSDK